MPPRRRPRAHNGGVQPPPSSVARVCKFYSEGNCRYGGKCKSLHSATQGDEPAVPSAAAGMDANTTLIPLQTSYGVTDLQAPIIEAEPAIEGVVAGQGLAGSGTAIPELYIQEVARPTSLPTGGKAKKKKACSAFRATGKCKKGDLCACNHNIKASPNGGGKANTQGGIGPQAAADLQQFAGLARDERRRQVEKLRKKVGEGIKHERTERERLVGERLERERASPNGEGKVNTQGGISPQAAAGLQQFAGLARDERRRQVEELRKKVEEGIKHERTERERVERVRLERERVERERVERERVERERVERERVERERVERERVERERVERERVERERAETERLERERVETERLERERLERERLERERLERERLEAEALERRRVEAERVARERSTAEAILAAERGRLRREREEKLAREREKVLQGQLDDRRPATSLTAKFGEMAESQRGGSQRDKSPSPYNEDRRPVRPSAYTLWNPKAVKNAMPKRPGIDIDQDLPQRTYGYEHIFKGTDIDPNDPLGYIRDLVEDDPNAIIVYFADDHASNSNALRGTSIVDILEEKGIDANKATLIPIGNDEVKKAFPTADTPIVFYIILGLSEREAETLIGEVYVPTDHGCIYIDPFPLPINNYVGNIKGLSAHPTDANIKVVTEQLYKAIIAHPLPAKFLIDNNCIQREIREEDINMEGNQTIKPKPTSDEKEKAAGYVRSLADTLFITARKPKAKGGVIMWSIFIDSPATEDLNIHFAWQKVIKGIHPKYTVGTTDPRRPNRWCATCQGHDHLADTCKWPTRTGWKKQVSLAPIVENQPATEQGTFNRGRGGSRGGGRGRGRRGRGF